MRGKIKHYNTRQDVLNGLNVHPDKTKAFLQRLLDERMQWITTGKLDEGDPGVEDETHRIAEITDEVTGGVIERYQEEWMEDPGSKIFRLGMAVNEVQELIQ
jgi:hypothetical protein